MPEISKVNPEEFGDMPSLVNPDEFPSWIIFEDENFLAVNKPGWVVCHPSKNGPYSSLIGAAREYLKLDVIHLVNRLDRETSGVVVFAKNKPTASVAQTAVDGKGDVSKKYLAIMHGKVSGCVTISQPLADDKNSRVFIKTRPAIEDPSAKSAVTIFTPISYSKNGDFTLAQVEIITGRKHQIRAHAQWMRNNIVGDKIYGPDENLYLEFIEKGYTPDMKKHLPIKRQALHAFEMDFTKVFGKKFLAPLKQDLLNFLKANDIPLPDKYNI